MRRRSLAWTDGTIALHGEIGPRDLSAAAMRRTLAELSDRPVLHVDVYSDGGFHSEGIDIFNLLALAGKRVEVTVRRAASMAAVVAMVGHRIGIIPGGGFMIHEAAACPLSIVRVAFEARFTAARIQEWADTTSNVDAAHLDILQARTRLPRSKLVELQKSGTNIDAAEALRLGFADEIVPTGG